VFADGDADTAQEVSASWEQIKAVEKPHRTSTLDGIPKGLPALASADKAAGRLSMAGRYDLAVAAAADEDLGSRLLALVLEARERGLDPEAALRATVRTLDSRL
jgi:XTP/dITP diphosphohydrolase